MDKFIITILSYLRFWSNGLYRAFGCRRLAFDIADLLIQSRVPFNIVMRLFVYRLPGVIVLTLPMAALLATILSFGKLATQSELTALKASGISFYRILRPVLLQVF